MKMMSSTSITSTIGVTLMSPGTVELWFATSFSLSEPPALISVARSACGRYPRARPTLADGGRTRLQALLEDEQEVQELLRAVVDLHRHELDAVHEVVVEPHGGNRHEESERRRDERRGDTGRDRRTDGRARL